LINLVSKYNIFLSSVNVNQLTRSEKLIGDELTFFEKSCKWSISNLSQKFSSCLAINDELSAAQVKELVQLPFYHLERLIARAQEESQVTETRLQIFVEAMTEQLLQSLLETHEVFRSQFMKEQNLIVFACMQELYLMAEKYIRPAMVERFNDVLILTIGDIAKRNYFTEDINQEYFDMLTSMF
jgi:hypothetical protein